MDDILVFKNSIKEHDKHLNYVLNRLSAKLNKNKCKFRNRIVIFLEHELSERGTKQDKKVILYMPPPKKGHQSTIAKHSFWHVQLLFSKVFFLMSLLNLIVCKNC